MMRSIVSILVMGVLTIALASYFSAEEIEDFVYDSKGKRNPFIPLMTEKTKLTAAGLENVQTVDDIVLEGIFWDAYGESIAILNGVIMKEGQQVGSVKVKDIREKGVTLFINEIKYDIDLVKKGDKSGGEE